MPVRDRRELRLVRELDDIEEAIRLALSWLGRS
jgi:hypothetical protein